MDKNTLLRWSGYALVVAAAACLAGGVMHPVVDGHAHSAAALEASGEAVGSALLLGGTVLLLLGLPAVYGHLALRLGRLGFLGFLLYWLGNLLSAIPHLTLMAFIAPTIARRAPDLVSDHDMIVDSQSFAVEQTVSGFVLVIGLLVLSISLLRASGIPRWIGALGLVGTAILFIPIPAHPVVTGLQIELARGVVLAAVGVVAVKESSRRGSVRAESTFAAV